MAIVEEGPQERGYGRAIVTGIVVGIPAVFLVTLLIALPGAGWPEAVGIALVPAIFGGPLFGGFAMVLREVARWEREERVVPAAAATTVEEHRVAA